MAPFGGLIINGRRIATQLKDLPSLPKDCVRLVHRTSEEFGKRIAEIGLYSKNEISGTASIYRTEEEFWNLFLEEGKGGWMNFGTTKVIMDMPKAEFDIINGSTKHGSHYTTQPCYNPGEEGIRIGDELPFLLCPSRYVVGLYEHDYTHGPNCLEILKKITRKNPPNNVERTDLKFFDQFNEAKLFEEVKPENDRAWEEIAAWFKEAKNKNGNLESDPNDWLNGFEIGV